MKATYPTQRLIRIYSTCSLCISLVLPVNGTFVKRDVSERQNPFISIFRNILWCFL